MDFFACFMGGKQEVPPSVITCTLFLKHTQLRRAVLWVVWSPENLRNLLRSLLNLIHIGHGHPHVVNCLSKPKGKLKKKKWHSPILWISKSPIASIQHKSIFRKLCPFIRRMVQRIIASKTALRNPAPKERPGIPTLSFFYS